MKTKTSIIQMLHQTREGKRRAVSPVIATLLLIAIAVAAAIVLYIFVSGLTGSLTQSGGQQLAEQLELQSYTNRVSPGSCGCAGQIVDMYLINAGTTTIQISSVYFDGTPLTVQSTIPTSGSPQTLSNANNFVYLVPATTTLGSGAAGQFYFSSPSTLTSYTPQQTGQIVITFASALTGGTSHIVKIVTQTGGTFTFTIVAGRSS